MDRDPKGPAKSDIPKQKPSERANPARDRADQPKPKEKRAFDKDAPDPRPTPREK